jgi:glycerophosphoryl diester phosphodiesterase
MKMRIIAHRGFWKMKSEQNTMAAFQRAIENGFGIETDFRYHAGNLVISHDLPRDKVLTADDLFAACFNPPPPPQYSR